MLTGAGRLREHHPRSTAVGHHLADQHAPRFCEQLGQPASPGRQALDAVHAGVRGNRRALGEHPAEGASRSAGECQQQPAVGLRGRRREIQPGCQNSIEPAQAPSRRDRELLQLGMRRARARRHERHERTSPRRRRLDHSHSRSPGLRQGRGVVPSTHGQADDHHREDGAEVSKSHPRTLRWNPRLVTPRGFRFGILVNLRMGADSPTPGSHFP